MKMGFGWVVGNIGAASLAACLCPAPVAALELQETDFSLPAQQLSRSLRQVSIQSGTSVIAPSNLVEGKMAPALEGRFAAMEAIRHLLEDSGLEVKTVGEALVVSRIGGSAEQPALAAESEPATIVVTGTNLRGAQPTSPVIVIRKSDIEANGSNSVEQLMRSLPQNAQNGVNRENFRATGAGADPTEHGAGLNLRGLGQRATLILVNGRRLAPSNAGSFVDVSLIPLSAIERVEVLTDGASAVYGSDAVGGVVNFILNDQFEGLEVQGLIGSTTKGDGDVRQAVVTGGTGWGSGRAMLSYEYRAEDEIVANDRSFTINLAPDTSILPRERRHSLFGNLVQELAPGLRAELTGSYARRDTDRSYFFTGSPLPVDTSAKAKMLSLSGLLRYQLGSDWQVRLDGGYSRNRTRQVQDEIGGSGLVNFRSTANQLYDARLRADGPLLELPGGPVRLALGAEVRQEKFSDEFRTRFINLPISSSRKVWAAFGEVQLPIFSALNRRQGLEQLILTAAGRYERYDGFGSTFNPKLGLLWSPLPGLALRSSYSTSFRAPLLSETTGAYSAIYVPASLVFVDPSPPSGVALALGGSSPDVKPEESRSWTVGLDYKPPSVPGLEANLNFYAIRFSDRIALPSPTITVVGDPAFDSIVTHDPDDALVEELIDNAQLVFDISGPGFTNGNATPADVIVIVDGRINNTARTVTQGLDAHLGYGFAWQGSRFQLDASATYIFSFKDQLRPTSETISALDTPYRPLDLRVRGHLGWARGGWSANIFLNYADAYRDNRGNRSIGISSFTTVDGGIAYRFGEEASPWLRGTRIALNGENLLNQKPPRLLPDPGSSAGLGYDPVNATGRGRFLSLQVRKGF